MCGIAGFIDHRLGHEESGTLIAKMLEAIAHRGPDARDTFVDLPVVLGHNRLSILDLSPEGNQPMHAFGTVIVFNGEVYNYRELRSELEAMGDRFRTQTDTEVVQAAYRRFGAACVQRFVGMWAFALWDPAKRLLFCSRDRFGIKPFHYIEQGGRFYFGSEYKALRPSPVFSAAVNVQQALRGLQLGWNAYHDESYYDSVKTLPAGCNLFVSEGRVKVERYWELHTEQTRTSDFSAAAGKFRELFHDSIRLHMRSDVEVGSCLSGGLDSSAITSAVSGLYPASKLKTFTVYYEGQDAVDERPWVGEVLKRYPGLDPYYFQPNDTDIRDSFEKAVYHADVPLAGSSPISQFFVMRLAHSKGVKVLLDGQGSDEYLAGYLHSFYRLIGGELLAFHPLSALRQWSAHGSMQGMSAFKRANVLMKSMLAGTSTEQRLYELEYSSYYPFLGKDKEVPFRLPDVKGSRLNRFLYQLMSTSSLPTLLQFEDRNSMAFSIESRVPFLDHRLVEFVFGLPDEAKLHNGVTKRLLRKSLEGILPEAIVQRKDKKGFVTPGEVKWLRGPLSWLLETRLEPLEFLNRQKGIALIDEFKKGENRNANLVWRLVLLDYWCKKYA
ncbi:MAG: Asparagine synthetase [Bacteroidota bacterium]|jgi:asparagine synthase (glutamine-hydrolysing)